MLKKWFLAYIGYPSNWYVYVSAIGWTAWVIFMVGYIIYTFATTTPPPITPGTPESPIK